MEHKGARELYDLLGEHLRTGRGIQFVYGLPDIDESALFKVMTYARDGNTYCLAPEPKRRLIRTEELPPVVWVRSHVRFGNEPCGPGPELCGLGLATSVSGRGLFIAGEWYTFDWLAEQKWEWSPDRREWHSFWVEDKD